CGGGGGVPPEVVLRCRARASLPRSCRARHELGATARPRRHGTRSAPRHELGTTARARLQGTSWRPAEPVRGGCGGWWVPGRGPRGGAAYASRAQVPEPLAPTAGTRLRRGAGAEWRRGAGGEYGVRHFPVTQWRALDMRWRVPYSWSLLCAL